MTVWIPPIFEKLVQQRILYSLQNPRLWSKQLPMQQHYIVFGLPGARMREALDALLAPYRRKPKIKIVELHDSAPPSEAEMQCASNEIVLVLSYGDPRLYEPFWYAHFDYRIVFEAPDDATRRKVVSEMLPELTEQDVEELVKLSDGQAISDVEAFCQKILYEKTFRPDFELSYATICKELLRPTGNSAFATTIEENPDPARHKRTRQKMLENDRMMGNKRLKFSENA